MSTLGLSELHFASRDYTVIISLVKPCARLSLSVVVVVGCCNIYIIGMTSALAAQLVLFLQMSMYVYINFEQSVAVHELSC